MQQYQQEEQIQEELQEDLNQFSTLKQHSLCLGQFGPEGINLDYSDPDNGQVGVLNIKRIFSYTDYAQLFDNIYIYRQDIDNFKKEQNTHYWMNYQTQILRIHQRQHLPMFFRHEKWKFTLYNHMYFMETNRCPYPQNYFFVLAKQLINIINQLHENSISHQKITPDNIVIIREIQYKFEFLSKPNEQQYYQHILQEYQIDSEGTAEDLKTRIIKMLQLDQATLELFLESKTSPDICVQSQFIKKIIDINRIAKLNQRDIRYVNFNNIDEYEQDELKLTNFTKQILRNDQISLEDWQKHMIKDYQDLGNILYIVWAQTFQRKINYNFASLSNYDIRQEIIQNLVQNNVFERILIYLLDGKNYEKASQEILQFQLQNDSYFYQHVYNDQRDFYQS